VQHPLTHLAHQLTKAACSSTAAVLPCGSSSDRQQQVVVHALSKQQRHFAWQRILHGKHNKTYFVDNENNTKAGVAGAGAWHRMDP
jgi:hypothetical protein